MPPSLMHQWYQIPISKGTNQNQGEIMCATDKIMTSNTSLTRAVIQYNGRKENNERW